MKTKALLSILAAVTLLAASRAAAGREPAIDPVALRAAQAAAGASLTASVEPDLAPGYMPQPAATPQTATLLCCVPGAVCQPFTTTSACATWPADSEAFYVLIDAERAQLDAPVSSGAPLGLSIHWARSDNTTDVRVPKFTTSGYVTSQPVQFCFNPSFLVGSQRIYFENFTGETVTFQNLAAGQNCMTRTGISSGELPPPTVPAVPIAHLGGLGGLLLGLGAFARRRWLLA